MDDIDRAQQYEELFWEDALNAHFRRTANTLGEAKAQIGTGRRPDLGGGASADAVHCRDCGAVIHPKRLEIFPDADRCVGCQSRWESRR